MANDVYQLVIQGGCAGEFYESVQHWQSSVASSSDPVGQAADLIAAFRANAESFYVDMIASDTSVTGYKCKRVNNGGGPTVMTPITPVVGTNAGTCVTSATAFCISTRYNQGGKWRAGHWFIPGIPESQIAGNTYSAGAITAASDFINAMGSMTGTLSIWTFGVWAAKTTTFFTPVYIALSPKIGIQKRRLLPVM